MKPLTIEELKALEVGDWVWVIEKFFDKPYEGYVTLFNYTPQSDHIFFRWQDRARHYTFTEYGTKWIAYKNKEQAEAKGEIIELSCKVGDTVYLVQDLPFNEITTYKITGIYYEKGETFVDGNNEYSSFVHVPFGEFCTSYAEAERRLAKLKKGIK